DHPRGTRPLVETGVGEARDKTAAGVEDSTYLADRAVRVLDVHKGHMTGDEIERPRPQKLESGRVRDTVLDPERLLGFSSTGPVDESPVPEISRVALFGVVPLGHPPPRIGRHRSLHAEAKDKRAVRMAAHSPDRLGRCRPQFAGGFLRRGALRFIWNRLRNRTRCQPCRTSKWKSPARTRPSMSPMPTSTRWSNNMPTSSSTSGPSGARRAAQSPR